MRVAATRTYWDSVVETWPTSAAGARLREYSDSVNRALLARWLPPRAGRLLKTDLFDEAVGAGLYPSLRERADEVVGVDLSTASVAAARRRYPELTGEVADVRSLSFESGSFDVVVSNSTLDHFESLEDIAQGIRELERVLVPGGILVISLDNPLNPLVALRNRLPFGWLHGARLVPYRVGATCGPRRLWGLLRRAGLEVTAETAIMHVPRVLVAGLGLPGLLGPGERLARTPVRYLTGQFVAARAVKR